MLNAKDFLDLQFICLEVRRRIFSMIQHANSGHIGGSSSSVELMVSLYLGGILKYDPKNPHHPDRDRVLVRGHLGPLRYSIFSLLGWINQEELSGYRTLGSKLQGHESMDLVPGVDITPSGSLGMILSYGVGAAVALTKQQRSSVVYVFLGDGEEQEGNISEAARHASHLGLNNLVCILDRNRKQLSGSTKSVDSGADVKRIWQAYGWSVREIANGHCLPDIIDTLRQPRDIGKPTLIIANTVKGYRLRDAETHFSGYHTINSCPAQYISEALGAMEYEMETMSNQLGSWRDSVDRMLAKITVPSPVAFTAVRPLEINIASETTEDFDEALLNYFRGLVDRFEPVSDVRLYVMTADWNDLNMVKACHFDRPWVNYIDVGIREQHLFAMAHGIAVTDPGARIILLDGDFLVYRAADQLHAMAQGKSRVVILGTDSGISEARNGPTHQSSGQPGMLFTIPGLTMLEPGDVADLNACLNWALTDDSDSGPVYIRLHSTKVSHLNAVERKLGFYVAYAPNYTCKLILVTAGFLIDNVVGVARQLDNSGIGAKVINVVNPNSLGESFVDILEPDIPILVVYNGNQKVLQSAVAVAVMAQTKNRPTLVLGHGFTGGTSGRMDDLVKHFGFDVGGLYKKIHSCLLNPLA